MNKKVAAPGLDHATPLYPQKLALTSPTGGGRSVGIVRSRTKATEFVCLFVMLFIARRITQSRGMTAWKQEKTMVMDGRKRKFVTASRRTFLVTFPVLTTSINQPYYSITLVLHIHAGQIALGHVNRGTV